MSLPSSIYLYDCRSVDCLISHLAGFDPVSSADGIISVVKETEAINDNSASSMPFDYHYDGAYLVKSPDICALFCINPGTSNTRTVFSDAHKAYLELLKMGYKETSLTGVLWSYKDRNGDLIESPIIQYHPVIKTPLLRCGILSNVCLRSVENSGEVIDHSQLLVAIRSAIYKSEIWDYKMESGNLLLWDNWRYLHSRRSNKINPSREILRLWLDRL